MGKRNKDDCLCVYDKEDQKADAGKLDFGIKLIIEF
jgi:hypothetical protein